MSDDEDLKPNECMIVFACGNRMSYAEDDKNCSNPINSCVYFKKHHIHKLYCKYNSSGCTSAVARTNALFLLNKEHNNE